MLFPHTAFPILSGKFLRLIMMVTVFTGIILSPFSALAESENETVRLQLKWKHAFQFAGYYAALEMGFYEDAGLDVEIIEHQGRRSPLEVLLAGDAEYAVTGSDIVLHRAHGEPVLALATIFQHSPYAFLVLANSGIEKVEDFRGRRVMLGAGAQDAALHATLRRAGLTKEDFETIPSSFDAHSLIRNETDVFNAYVTDQGFALQEAGFEGRYLLPKQYNVDFYGDILATTEQEAELHHDRLIKFRDASLKGWEYALNHTDVVIALILEKYNTQELSREHLEYEMQASRELIQPLLVKIGYMNPQRWEHIKKIFTELEFITSGSSIDGLVFEEKEKVHNWAQWIVDHKVFLTAIIVLFFITVLLLLLFQMRRLVLRRTAELAASEQHWRALVDAEPACVNTMSADGCLVSINISGMEMMEADTFADIKGMSILQLIEEDDKGAFLELLENVFEGGAGNLVFRLTGLKGSRKWIEIHAVPFRDSEGKITRLLGVSHDLTERKEAESRQEQLQREVSQKHKMVALGQLSGGIAHDFNNILGIVVGYTELASACLESEENSKLATYLKKVEKASGRARDLVSQLLAFSSGGTKEVKPTMIRSLIEEDLKMSRSTIPASIEIVTHLAVDVPLVKLDPVQLHQVVMNLIINARDAMGGVGVLTVRLSMVHDLVAECHGCLKRVQGDWVELSVSDTGSGIPSDILQRLFEPFFTTKEVGKGTGMGLAVIHGIMIRLGGHILVETELGKGSTFRLLFPPVLEELPDFAQQDPRELSIPKGEQRLVLVLDDEPELANFLGDLLELYEYQVLVTTNPVVAYETFKEKWMDISLLITDQTMPGISGVDLAQLCRGIKPGLPIIICTGFSESIDEKRADKLNLGYVRKPIDTNELLQLAGEVIRAEQSGD